MNKYVLILIVATLFVGCLKTRAELEAEETGQQQQRQTVAQQRTNSKETHEIGREKAPASAYRFEEYDEQLRTLSGRVDSLENNSAQVNASKQGDRESFAKEKQAIDQKFVAYEDALKKMEAQITALNDEVNRLKAPPPPDPPPTPAASGANKIRAFYDSAEEQFTRKKWKEAIVNFQKYRDQAPKGKMYGDSTYKIGVCFQELGMKDEAKAFYEEVSAKFPNSKEAKKAAFRMKSLK